MSQLQAVENTQSTPQTRSADSAGARRVGYAKSGRAQGFAYEDNTDASQGVLRSRASFLLPNGGNRIGARTPGTGPSQQQLVLQQFRCDNSSTSNLM